MVGHKWHKAEAKVVLSKVDTGTDRRMGHVLEFVVDVRTRDGRFFRALLNEPPMWSDFWPPVEGQIVGLEVEGDTRNVRFDKSDPRLSAKEHDRRQQSDIDIALSQPPGSDPNAAWPGEQSSQSSMAAAHPEWNHTRNMHNAAGRKPPPQHNLP